MTDLVWSFSAWVAFLLAVRIGDVRWGAGAGVIVAGIVLVRAMIRHKAHLFDVVGFVYFAGLLVLLTILQPGNLDTWGRYAQAVAHGSLTLIVFASILINRPFTEPYPRERVPKECWGIPEFHALNRKISLAFGLAFLLGTISLVIAGVTDELSFILRLVVPFGALGLAFMFTEKQSGAAAGPTVTTGAVPHGN